MRSRRSSKAAARAWCNDERAALIGMASPAKSETADTIPSTLLQPNALRFWIALLATGLLTGLGFGVEPTGRHNDGCFIAVFNVAAFRDLNTFKQEVTEFAQYLKATPPAQGFTEVLYPGEIEFKREQDRRKNGIPVEDATWKKLQDLAQGY